MIFNMNMFDVNRNIIVVESVGYESILKHRHSFIEIVYVRSGEAYHNIEGKDVKIRAGDLFIIANSAEHSIRPICEEKEFRITNVVCNKELFRDTVFPEPDEIFSMKELQYGKSIDAIAQEYSLEEPSEHILALLVKRLAVDCALEKALITRGKRQGKPRNRHAADYIQATIDYIQEHYMDKILLKDIAGAVGLYPAYLQKIFHDNRSTGVVEYLIHYRMERACRLLLETDDPISKISHLVGITDAKNFYTTFRKFFGVTPKEYRDAHRDSEGKSE